MKDMKTLKLKIQLFRTQNGISVNILMSESVEFLGKEKDQI